MACGAVGLAPAPMAASVPGLAFVLEDFTEEPGYSPVWGDCVYVEVPPAVLGTALETVPAARFPFG